MQNPKKNLLLAALYVFAFTGLALFLLRKKPMEKAVAARKAAV